jgi:tetratricopeptide (TPR) repeat protein
MKEETKDFTPDEAVMFGEGLESSGDLDNAETMYRSVIHVDPNHFHAQFRLGTILTGKKQYYEALYRLDRALKINRKSELALSNRGMVMSLLNHHEEALADFQKALAIDGKNYVTLSNLGNTLERLGRYQESLEAFDMSLALDPDSELTHYNKGVALFRLGRNDEAILSFDRAIRIKPDYHYAIYNRGLSRLLAGDMIGGFADCEAGLQEKNIRRTLFGPFKRPQWQGEDFKGKTLLIVGEQGLGDTIHFMRYLPYAQERGDQIIVAVHEKVRSLYKLPGIKLLAHGETCPPFDLQCPLMSLPHRMGMADQFPPPLPIDWYRHTMRLAHWADRIGTNGDKLNVGICWSGNFGHRNDDERSIPLHKLKKLLATRGVNFYGLQKDVRPDDEKVLDGLILDGLTSMDFVGKELSSFTETAAAIENLDLVITVDTSVAHLAASLGVPTWIMISHFGSDWRWQLKREDSPWYPSVILYRQPKRGDWEPVFTKIMRDLAIFRFGRTEQVA